MRRLSEILELSQLTAEKHYTDPRRPGDTVTKVLETEQPESKEKYIENDITSYRECQNSEKPDYAGSAKFASTIDKSKASRYMSSTNFLGIRQALIHPPAIFI